MAQTARARAASRSPSHGTDSPMVPSAPRPATGLVSSRPGTPDRSEGRSRVPLADSMTLSDGEVRENARRAVLAPVLAGGHCRLGGTRTAVLPGRRLLVWRWSPAALGVQGVVLGCGDPGVAGSWVLGAVGPAGGVMAADSALTAMLPLRQGTLIWPRCSSGAWIMVLAGTSVPWPGGPGSADAAAGESQPRRGLGRLASRGRCHLPRARQPALR